MTAAVVVRPTPASCRPAVSCVMIFLDAARFIDDSIRSVVAQTREDWELILVDDGSSDASSAIARRWAATDPRISYVDHDGHANLGMSASRNRGIAEARGEVVTFLDSDDLWMPSALAHRLRVLAAHPTADATVGGTWRWYSWTGDAADTALDNRMGLPPTVPLLRVVAPPAAFIGVYGNPQMWCTPAVCSLVVRRDRLLAVGGSDAEFAGLYEDHVLYTKVFLALRVVFDERILSLYRQHDASACARAIGAGEWHPVVGSAARDRFMAWLADYVPSRSNDAALRRVLARNLSAPLGVGATSEDPLTTSRSRGSGSSQDDRVPSSSASPVARVRRVAGLLVRRVQFRLGLRRDVAWLVDHWTQQHVSGWPESSVTVADVAPVRWLRPAHSLRRLRSQVDDATAVVAMVPARRRPSTRLSVRWPTAATLVRDAREAFPGSLVTVEPFGNGRIRRAVAAGAHVWAVPPVELDRHDADAPLVWALTVTPTPCRRSPADGRPGDATAWTEHAPAVVEIASRVDG